MNLVIARLSDVWGGFTLYDVNRNKTLLQIDGRNPQVPTPTALLTMDPHSVYGLSHPTVITQILSSGPAPLLTTPKIAHNLYEHGMKSSWGTMDVGNCSFLTRLETFYDVIQVFNFTIGEVLYTATIEPTKDSKQCVLKLEKLTDEPKTWYISSSFHKPEHKSDFFNLSLIKDYAVLE